MIGKRLSYSAKERLTEQESLDWGKWLAVDDDGSARVFKSKPMKVSGYWITRDFPKKMYAACYRVEGSFNEYWSGTLFEKSKNGWKPT
jgi:hypothetical protein